MRRSRVICLSHEVSVLGVADLCFIHLKRRDLHRMRRSFLRWTSLASHPESATIHGGQISFSLRWNSRCWAWLWVRTRRLSQHQISTDTNASEYKKQHRSADDHEWCGFSLWRGEVDDHLLLCWSSRRILSGV